MEGTLAIDLGSTTTVVAFQAAGAPPKLLALEPYSLADPCVVPSLLWLASADAPTPLVGRQVVDAGLAHHTGPQLHRDFKRWIGQEGPNQKAPSSDQASPSLPLTAEQAGELLLLQLWRALPDGIEPARLVLTAPIDAYPGYRRWLEEVCRQLPVPELALVDEPTAAAIGSGLAPGSTVLVVDLGGGTVDLALVQLQGGEGRAAPIAQLLRLAGRNLPGSRQRLRCAQVLGKAGLAIGGRDLDRWIATLLCPNQPLEGSLLAVAEQLKCQLSESEQARALWSDGQGRSHDLVLSRQDLDQLLQQRGFMAQLDQLLNSVLAQARGAGISETQIDAVLPVGGSSRLPMIQTWLQHRCGAIPLRDQRPVEAVALGALSLTPGVRVRDVLARGVSLRCWDQRSQTHRWHPLYVPGQSWPTEAPLEMLLSCSQNGQTSIELVLGEPSEDQRAEVVFVEGQPVLRARPAGNPQVEAWSQQPTPLPLSSPGHQGVDRLRLRFSLDAHTRLQLEVEDLCTGHTQTGLTLGPVR